MTARLRIIDPERRVGPCVHLQQTLLETLIQPGSGEYCRQFYLGGRISYDCRKLSELDRQAVLEHCVKHDQTFYIHTPLHLNMARPDGDPKIAGTINTLQEEMHQVRDLPASCVLHVGKACAGGTISTVGRRINDLQLTRGTHRRTPFPLLMENAAGQGTELGTTWDELRRLFEVVDGGKVGLCLDTQHLFGAGQNHLQSHDDIVKMFDQVDEICSSGVSLFHLNDSAKPFNSKVDRHASIRQGYIWARQDEGLVTLLQRCHESSIDMILETPTAGLDLALIQSCYQVET